MTDTISLPRAAAQRLLDDLNARIDSAHLSAVPVFPGIVELHDALAASHPPLGPLEAWQELCEKTDRTSPADYPDMCLITFEELRMFMAAAIGCTCGEVAGENPACPVHSDEPAEVDGYLAIDHGIHDDEKDGTSFFGRGAGSC